MSLPIKSAATIRDDGLRTTKNGLVARGVTSPNVGPSSDYYGLWTGIGNECAAAQAYAAAELETLMPDVPAAAPRWLTALTGAGLNGPSPSTGRAIFATSAATIVATGAQLLDPLGNRCQVVAGGVFADGDGIQVQSLATGLSTSLPSGTVLTWVSPPPFAGSTVTLDANGMTGGRDAETLDDGMQRVLARFRNPAGGGNPAALAAAAESVGAFIQAAFVHPACNGPGTVHLTVCGAATSSNRSRAVAAANVAIALSAVVGETSGDVEVVLTSSVDVAADVAFLLSIPAAVGAGSSGGGWVDAAPWPTPYTPGTPPAVTLVTSTTDITIGGLAALPAVGQSIAFVAETGTRALYTAKVLSVPSTSGAGPYAARVTLDAPLVGVAVGSYVFPAAARSSAYVSAVLDAFAALGPGEKTNAAGLLPFAYRRPLRVEAWDYSIGAKFLRALTSAGSEVLDAAWCYQNGGTTTPPLPASIALGAGVFVPRRVAFYPA